MWRSELLPDVTSRGKKYPLMEMYSTGRDLGLVLRANSLSQ